MTGSQAASCQRSAGIIVVHCRDSEFHYLLLRAYRYWDFPKGRVAAGEPPLAAARRETQEETGITDLEFRWGESFVETAPYAVRGGGSSKVARYYLAYASATDVVLGVNPQLGRPEHHDYRWLPYAPARKRLGKRVRVALDWAHGVIGEWC
jgi:8-oxo-dGTP pyrophosphatase MutT (NUDIX family)